MRARFETAPAFLVDEHSTWVSDVTVAFTLTEWGGAIATYKFTAVLASADSDQSNYMESDLKMKRKFFPYVSTLHKYILIY